MAFSGGTFSRLYDWTTDRDNGVKILASRMDQEFDGMATGLSTCILKDGTQTCTAAIPFAQGITLPDNKTIILGTNSDITIQYDESTNDSLEIAANVEGAALGIVLKADQGDDNADQHKVGIADGGTLTMASKISGSFVSYLTHTPNSTVASSTTAVAGNLTVGGDLTLGSGAVISEAELETIDGITPGTAAASKAMVLDASLDISGGRNLTISGELDAATLDVSGDVDIDGTLETDALSIASTAVTATAAELNYSDTGAAVGTVVASKVVTADANKDVASFRNITLTGELDAGSLDVSGNADIDGTLEADAITVNGTALNTVIAGVTVTDATNSAHVLVTDNESTNEENLITFVEDATSSTGNVGLEMDGNLTYNPSTGTVTATVFKGNIDAVDGDFDGTLEADAMTLNGTAITATATLDTGISNNNVPKFTSGVADNDFLRVDGTAIEGRSAAEVLSDIAAAPAAGSSNIVTTGALNSGSITSGFGAIDNGASGITTTGVITGGTLEATADTSAGDNAAIGYTSAEGLILTGQGSTSDITLKNDADATVFTVPTGTDDILFPDSAKILMGNSSDLALYHDGSNSYIVDNGTGDLVIQASDDLLLESTSGENYINCNNDGSVEVFYNGGKKFETTSTGADITGVLTSDGLTVDTNTLHVDAANNHVGIGTVSPSLPLHINGASAGDGLVYSRSGTEYFRIDDTGTDMNIKTTGGGHQIIFTTNGSEVGRWRNGGGLTFNGDTAAANALDDYEEGLFTPNLIGSAGGEASYSSRHGTYTKIGRLVTVNIIMVISSVNTMSGDVLINTLPFSVSSILTNTSLQANGSVGFFGGLSTAVSSLSCFASASSTNAGFQKVTGTSSTSMSDLTVSDIGNSFALRMSLAYYTT